MSMAGPLARSTARVTRASQRHAMASKTWRMNEFPRTTTFAARPAAPQRRSRRAAANGPPRPSTTLRQLRFVESTCIHAVAGGFRGSSLQL